MSRISLSAVATSVLVNADVSGWTKLEGLTCSEGRGAVPVDDTPLTVTCLEDCMARCDDEPTCDAITVSATYDDNNGPECFRRAEVTQAECDEDFQYDTWVKASQFDVRLAVRKFAIFAEVGCKITDATDCAGNDLEMIHNFGLNGTDCCARCAANPSCMVAVLATDQGGVCMLKSGCPSPTKSSKRVRYIPGNKPAPPAPVPKVPNWNPTYVMKDSTVIMPCNFSGLYDFDAHPELARFGLVDYDWSNGKMEWVQESPMACQGSMMEQVRRQKQLNPSAKFFVYRNIVKALPWFEEVREKLEDPAYWGWFLWYKPGLRNGTSAGGNLYHDQEQTPGWPGGGDGGPDGICHNHTQPPWGEGCDCGKGVPCGEYLFDHRNASLRAWLTEQFMAGKEFGLGNDLVDGYYLDDNWSDRGPSEEDKDCVDKMGLTKKDVAHITAAWKENMQACQRSIVENDGFNWQLFEHAGTPSKSQCAAYFRAACQEDSKEQTTAVQFVTSVKKQPQPQPWSFSHAELDLATFLLARGPHAWLGYGWMGCGCGWEDKGTMDCGGYPRPVEWDRDYGEPLGLCEERSAGVFTREWTQSSVTVDCNAYTSHIAMEHLV